MLPVTAVREVLEEGGARLALGRRLDSVRYNVGGRPKRVHYWSASVTSLDDRAVPNDEVDEIEWVAADRAAERISYNRDNAVVADFARLPPRTFPVILLRHAKAVAKSHWKRADDRRPLDDAGRADAKALAEVLACFGPRARLITSPAARCVETLRPFAELSGAELREEPSLYIHHHSSRTVPPDSHPSIAALLSEAVNAGEPTIICAHRENIPVLQAAALAALGVTQPPSDAAPGSALPTAPCPQAPNPPAPSPTPPSHPSPTSPRSGTTPSPPPASGSSTSPSPHPHPPPAPPRTPQPPPTPRPPPLSTPPAPHISPRTAPPHRTAPPGAAGSAPAPATRAPAAPPPAAAATSCTRAPLLTVTPPALLAAPVSPRGDRRRQARRLPPPPGLRPTAQQRHRRHPGTPPAPPARPAPRLISADRYDLTEP